MNLVFEEKITKDLTEGVIKEYQKEFDKFKKFEE